ncbi:MAG: signal peptide peptidase SppA [Candidatus Cloacimonadota bacterium]|nr:MAG: signal peptide peptidase SppA [Candidatus Cloacimonadota bacterium]
MKKIIFVIAIISLLLSLGADEISGFYESTNDYAPVAYDSPLSTLKNPSANAFGNNSGFTYMTSYDDDGFDQNYWLMYANKNFAFSRQRKSGNSYFRAAFTGDFSFVNNLYTGIHFDWRNKSTKTGDVGFSLLYRPCNYFSFGGSINAISEDAENYVLGVAIRPFIGGYLRDRFSISADFSGHDSEFYSPVVGMRAEPLNGLFVNGSYDFESETARLGLELAFGGSMIGQRSFLNKDNEHEHSYLYVHASDKYFRSMKFSDKKTFKEYKLANKIVDKKSGFKLGFLDISFNQGAELQDIVAELKRMKKDDRIQGLYIDNGNFSSQFANFEELRDAFLDFKESGKPVIFYFDSISNATYVFASSIADEIYLNPTGQIDLKGIAISSPYFKTLFDTLGVEFVNFKSHKYKTAGNNFTETEMTPAERESYEFVLQGIFDNMANMIQEGRGDKLKKSAVEVINNGPYFSARQAYEEGLTDGLYYRDEIKGILEEEYNAKVADTDESDLIKYEWKKDKTSKVALIYAVGAIHTGEGKAGKTIGSESLSKAIRKARKDKSVKGIIMRVNSGGGSALASDIIAREVWLTVHGKNKKPFVVSMGGAAASGGYYISAYADKIIAEPTTITGSIGVIGMMPNFEKLFDKLHVNWSTVKKGKQADIYSVNRKMTDKEYNMIKKSVEKTYEEFINAVAEGRGMTRDEVHKIAQGRIWTGEQGLANGLVDIIGGMETAEKVMGEMINNPNLKLTEYRSEDSFVKISSEIGSSIEEKLNPFDSGISGQLMDLTKTVKLFGDEKVLYWLPWDISNAE